MVRTPSLQRRPQPLRDLSSHRLTRRRPLPDTLVAELDLARARECRMRGGDALSLCLQGSSRLVSLDRPPLLLLRSSQLRLVSFRPKSREHVALTATMHANLQKQLLERGRATAFSTLGGSGGGLLRSKKKRSAIDDCSPSFATPFSSSLTSSLSHTPPPQNQNRKKTTAEANPRDQGLPPHGPSQGRPRRPRQEGRGWGHQVQGPLLAPPLHARRRRRREGEQAQAVAAPGARRARQPLKGQENDIKTAQYF